MWKCLLALPFFFYNAGMVEKKPWSTLINKVIRFIFDIADYIVTVLFWLLAAWETKRTVPPIKSKLLTLTAKEITEKIKNKEIKCVDVVEAYINRIKEVDPLINAVVQDRFGEALVEATVVDNFIEEKIQVGAFVEDRPLLGVPITVKESIAVKDLSNNAARSRVPLNKAKEDALVVQHLRRAGAIPLLVSNVPELCFYFETWNQKFGRTNNPYDTRRTCGGSSGGEASLVGAGASLVGIASEFAGSLRLSSDFCGVYGHKPTPGYVPIEGHIPSSSDKYWSEYFTIGPITRYAEDLEHMLKPMIRDGNKLQKLRLDHKVDMSKLRVLYSYGEGARAILQSPPQAEAVKAVKTAVTTLRTVYRSQIEEGGFSEMVDTLYFNFALLCVDGIENVFQTDDENPDDWGLQEIITMFIKKLTLHTSASIPCLLYGPMKYIADSHPMSFETSLKELIEMARLKIIDNLQDDGVLVYPTFHVEAPFHNTMFTKIPEISYCTIFNILGLPVTQVPIHLNKEGIPVGIQVIAAPHQDRLCLAVAKALEKAIGGWQQPPKKQKKSKTETAQT